MTRGTLKAYFASLFAKGYNIHPDDNAPESMTCEEARQWEDSMLDAFQLFDNDVYDVCLEALAEYLGTDTRNVAL